MNYKKKLKLILKVNCFKNMIVIIEKFEGVNILDALSASGLRSIRYAKELTGVKKVINN